MAFGGWTGEFRGGTGGACSREGPVQNLSASRMDLKLETSSKAGRSH